MIPASGCWLKDSATACSRSSALAQAASSWREQGQGLPAHGLLDEGELAHLRDAERVAQPGGFGVDAAAAAGLFQQAAELGEGQRGGCGRGGGGGQDGAGLGPGDAAAGAAKAARKPG